MVYSNIVTEVVPGVKTKVVNSDLKCEKHEVWWNTPIFIAVWAAVVQEGRFDFHDWTVKVDPDTVFFPDRLRSILQTHPTAGFVANCKYGLHGPMEVFAKSAMEIFAYDYMAGGGSQPT